MRGWFVFLMICIGNMAYANVALDELNHLLSQKAQQQVTTQHQNTRLEDLRKNYYFIFIYRASCPHCQQFAPVLKDFSQTFLVKTKAYAVDGESLPGLQSEPLTPELFQTLYAKGAYKPAVPALFLVNRHTLKAYTVLFGEANAYQLAKRVDELMRHIEERFHD